MPTEPDEGVALNPVHAIARALRPPAVRVLLAVLAAVALLVPTGVVPVGVLAAGADLSLDEARRHREEARAEQVRAVREIDLLAAEDAEVRAALDEVERAVAAQQARLDDARRALEDARAELQHRRQELAATEEALARSRAAATDLIVDSYVSNRTDLAMEAMLGSSDPAEAAVRRGMLAALFGSRQDLIDGLRAAGADRAAAAEAAEAALEDLAANEAAVAAAFAELDDRRALQAEIQAELQQRIAAWERKLDDLEREETELTDLIRRRQQEQLRLPTGATGATSAEGFRMPTAGQIGSGFGMRLHPIYGSTRLHTGVDIAGPTGQAIWASKEGRVIFAGWRGGYGNTVVISHEGLVSTLYAHLSQILVGEGTWVDGGEVVGLMGSTGLSTGPHLHFEVRVDGVPKDPQLFLP